MLPAHEQAFRPRTPVEAEVGVYHHRPAGVDDAGGDQSSDAVAAAALEAELGTGAGREAAAERSSRDDHRPGPDHAASGNSNAGHAASLGQDRLGSRAQLDLEPAAQDQAAGELVGGDETVAGAVVTFDDILVQSSNVGTTKATRECIKTPAALDAALRRLNLGIATWLRLESREDGSGNYIKRDLGYAKVGNKWGIALRSISGTAATSRS